MYFQSVITSLSGLEPYDNRNDPFTFIDVSLRKFVHRWRVFQGYAERPDPAEVCATSTDAV